MIILYLYVLSSPYYNNFISTAFPKSVVFGGLYTTFTALSALKHHNNIVTIVYKPPNTTLFGKAVEMKFKVASGSDY